MEGCVRMGLCVSIIHGCSFLGPCEEVLCHHTRFNFSRTTKKLKTVAETLPSSAGSREDEHKQKRPGSYSYSCFSSAGLKRLKGKIQLKTRVTYIAPVICRHNDDLPACDLGILKYKQLLPSVCGDVTARQILQLHQRRQTATVLTDVGRTDGLYTLTSPCPLTCV